MKTGKPLDFERYVAAFPASVQHRLGQIRTIIKKAAPEATEHISYGLPVFKVCGKPLVYFAGHKYHIGFYATPNAHAQFTEALSGYKQGKGSVQFPQNQPLPVGLIRRMVAFRLQQTLQQFKSDRRPGHVRF